MKEKRLIIRSVILLVMIVAIGYTFYSHFAEERGVVDKGDMAPNFALVDLEGNTVELEDFRGKGVYVNFWATYCSICRVKMQYLNEHYDEYKDKGIEILSVNVDESTVQVDRHKQRHELSYSLYIDRNMLVSNAYGVAALPTVFLIDEHGKVIERQIGGKTEEQVLEALEKIIPDRS